MKSNSEIFEVIQGNYFLNSPDYVFIFSNGSFNIKPKEKVNAYDTVIMCSECGTLPAIVLDKLHGKGIDDFTLCMCCLDDFNKSSKKGNENENCK